MKSPKWAMKCNALNKDIFERERAMQLWPYVEIDYIIYAQNLQNYFA